MKKMTSLLLCLLLAGSAFAQMDTLDVPVDADGWGFLKEFVDENGEGHVYRLARGGVYWMTGQIQNTFPLHIYGEPGPEETMPAMIMVATDQAGQRALQNFAPQTELVFRNVYIANIDDLGINTGCVRVVGVDDVSVTFDNCVVQYCWDWQGVVYIESAQNTSIIARNSILWNLQRIGGFHWSRFMFSRPGCHNKEIIYDNCTLFGVMGELFSVKEPAHKVRMNHNTFVTEGQGTEAIYDNPNIEWTNNIFYDVMAHGDALTTTSGFFRGETTGDLETPLSIFMIDTVGKNMTEAQLDSYLTVVGVPHQTCVIKHNAVYWSDEVKAYLDAQGDDVVLVPTMINEKSRAIAANDAEFPGVEFDEATNWDDQDPGFTNNPTPYENLTAWIGYQLYGEDAIDFIVDTDDDPFTFDWPLSDVFDFTYSNETLLTGSSTGGPLGDLYHWYPEAYATSVKGIDVAPTHFTLEQNYPNPFNPTTTIAYALQNAGNVTLSIYNVNGAKVKTLVNEAQAPGSYNVSWNAVNAAGHPVSAGVYVYKLEVGNQTQVQKMMLVK